MTTYKICCLPGDGIGPEIIAEGKKVLRAVGERAGVTDKARPVPRRGRGCVLRGRPGGQLRHGPLLGRARRA